MTFELLYLLIKSYTVTCIIVFVTLVLVLGIIDLIIRCRHTEKLLRVSVHINTIPFLAGLIPLSGLFPLIHNISRALAPHAGSCDTKVAAAGFQEMFLELTVFGGLFFIFLEAWLIVRMIYGRFLRELDTFPKR
jgi:hypothetical protein